MNRVALMSAKERAGIFAETAARMGLADAIVEKDFWVCWVLQRLFSTPDLERRLLFKGGTSLSKVFHAIDRFSEDLDLAVDYTALGFTGNRDPRQEDISKTRRVAILEQMMAACREYVSGPFVRTLEASIQDVLGEGSWNVTVSPQDPNIVNFVYPAAQSGSLDYIAPHVVLELGTHAEFVPHGRFAIRSFVAETFPNVVEEAEISVLALLAKRTFWEKVTILHAEYYRPAEKPLPARYSRHYYDVAQLAGGPIRAEALADFALLADVVRHKQTFYPSGWARYELARKRSLRLVPPDARRSALERDYWHMGVMLFGESPEFDTIMETLAELEREINA